MQKKGFVWPIIRIGIFLLVGISNSIFLAADKIGSWENYVGYGFIIVGTLDALFLLVKLKRLRKTN